VSQTYLDFERPLAALDARIDELRRADRRTSASARELKRLTAERRRIERNVYGSLSAWQRVQLARHVDRPQTLDYVRRLCTEFVELRGDRSFGDDPAIVAGLGVHRGSRLAVVGHQRGHTPAERVRRNFGMASPEGYRKAQRLLRLAERLDMPVLTFVDTQGAYAGIGAEERGQAEAIARTLRTMALLRTPIVSVVIGEGGSGGALALGAADRLLMLEYSCYSVISPEGCASILYRNGAPDSVARAAEALRLTARELHAFGIADELVREGRGGAHRSSRRTTDAVAAAVTRNLDELVAQPIARVLAARYAKHRRLGAHLESRVAMPASVR
jgi:acetyl-CoA carboxylase carboxyl transferase subunit alpha